jgi:biotin carboxylase
MERVLMILPSATYRATEFLAAAARLDVDVLIASDEYQALAEVRSDHFIQIDLDDTEAAARELVAVAADTPVDAIVAVDEQGVVVAALASQLLGLSHNDPDAVRATKNKAEMRARLERAGVRQPQYLSIAPGGDVRRRVSAAAQQLGYPCVVKPSNLAASRGVIRVDNDAQAIEAAGTICRILGLERDGTAVPLVVERFVPGTEVALEGLLDDGELAVLALFDKPDPLDGPYFEETIYVTPSRRDRNTTEQITRLVERAAKAIGLTEGPIHAEVRLSPVAARISGTKPGVDLGHTIASDSAAVEPVMIEIAARSIGGRCSTALSFAAERSLEELVLVQALGRSVPVLSRPRHLASDTAIGPTASGVMMIPIPRSGTLLGATGLAEALSVDAITAVEIAIAPGRPVRQLPYGDRYLGFIFARAASPAKVEGALREAHAKLDFDIEPFGTDDDLFGRFDVAGAC